MMRPLSLPGHGMTARSKSCMSPNSVRVPPPGSGTVTSDRLGRTSCTNGKSEYLGKRGTMRRAITRLVDASMP